MTAPRRRPIAYQLIPLANPSQGGYIMERRASALRFMRRLNRGRDKYALRKLYPRRPA